jgi:hypothetical protein
MRIVDFSCLRTVASMAAITILILAATAGDRSYAVALIQQPIKNALDQSSDQQILTVEQMEHFLRSAKVIGSKQSKKGLSSPPRLTLSDGTLTHDASFQSINEFEPLKKFDDGSTEINFRDSYHYNIAAYEIAKMLGLGDMMPVYVERKWNGKSGSLSWWLSIRMDEADRFLKKIPVPDVDAWNHQMYKIRVFSALLYDKDRNLTNVLIGDDWKLYMIDFTRAFRLRTDLPHPGDLVKCDRHLLDKLRQLNKDDVMQKTTGYASDARFPDARTGYRSQTRGGPTRAFG